MTDEFVKAFKRQQEKAKTVYEYQQFLLDRIEELEKENAELKAHLPRWYTPSEKLPEECSIVLALDNLDDGSEPSTYEFVCSDQWEWLPRKIAVLSNDQIKRWCEIPRFEE